MLKINVSGESKTTNTVFDIEIGYSAWLTSSVALEPVAFFNINTEKDEDDVSVSTNKFGLRLGLQVFIGR